METDNVLECVWCEGRIHARCNGMSEDQCCVLDTVTNNIVFFVLHVCNCSLPLLSFFDSLSLVDTKVAVFEKSVLEIQKAENLVLYQPNTIVYINLLLNYPIRFHPSQIKIKYYSSLLKPLSPMEVNSETDSSVASNFIIPPQNTPNAAQAIVDKLADRERRKHNIIEDYNFPECTDHQADIESFQKLLDTVFTLHLK